MKKRKFNLGNILLLLFLVLLLIPQTRTPIQVAVNKIKIFVFTPSFIEESDQTQLKSFNYQVTAFNGDSKSIAIGKGRITFISYWATWCPPCIAELPSIQKLYADYGDKIDFILLTNEKPEVVQKFLEKKAFKLPVYFPKMKTPKSLYDNSIPTNYIIDATGKIIIKETGAADWNSTKVRKVLDGLLTR